MLIDPKFPWNHLRHFFHQLNLNYINIINIFMYETIKHNMWNDILIN